MRRRAFLAALLAALAGCGGGGSDGTETPTGAAEATASPTPTATPTATPSPTPTPTATPTPSSTPAVTPTPTATASGSDPGTPTPEVGGAVSDVTLAAVGATPEDPVAELSVRYNGRAQRSIDPGSDPQFYRPAPGNKFLVVRMAVENVGPEAVDLTPWLFVVHTSDAVYRYEALADHPNPFLGTTVEPDDTLLGWSAYELPAGVTEAILAVDGDTFIGPVAAEFTHDPALAIGVPP